METVKTIALRQFCKYYDIPESFIVSLSEYDLIVLVQKENDFHIQESQISEIEKLIRLHYDLEINFEGLDVITNLMQQIEHLQNELLQAQNKLNFYN